MMELRVLRYFLAVADHGSVTAAAQVVHVAQSSLSRQLRALERELGADLFARTAGRLRLSTAGKTFLPIARDIVARADAAKAVMRSLSTGETVGLRVAAPPTTVADILAPYVVAAGPEGAIVDLREHTPEEVYEVLDRGEADLGISTLPPSGRLATEIVWEAPLYAIVPPDHRFSGAGSLPLADLLDEPLVLLDRRSVTRRLFDDAVARAGLRYVPAYETGSSHFAQALAAAGRGVAILSDDPSFGLRSLRIDTGAGHGALSLALFAAWDPAHYAEEVIEGTVASISRFAVELYGSAMPLRHGYANF